MRLVIQRVSEASVSVINKKKVVGEIGKGLFILVGVKRGDTEVQAKCLADKLLKLRVMSDAKDKMNVNITDAKGEILLVSQFTLHADTESGNRPSFLEAAPSEEAKKLYEYFVEVIQQSGVPVQTGSFGEYMKIDAVMDGPVTILLEK